MKTRLTKLSLLSAVLVSAAARAQGAPAAPTPAPGVDTTFAAKQFAPATVPSADGSAAPKSFTGVEGFITDAKTGDPLIECVVKVTAGAQTSATTDLEGHFVLPLPPGKYDLRVWYDQYKGVDVKGLTVVAGKTTRRDLKLEPIEAEFTEEVVVVAVIDESSESGLLFERKRAATVSDAISAQELSRTPDSSAADAVKRVPSVTVLDNKTVVMRGLSGRYAAATVNGVPLPSPDSDGHSVPLDLFPTGLLQNLSVQKSYSAELPGTFAGGLLALDTNSYPDSFKLQTKLSVGGDTESTFRNQLRYQGGRLDALTFDDGTRELPELVPSNAPVTGAGVTSRTLEQMGEQFNSVWGLDRRRALPSFGASVNAGDTLKLAGGRRLGYLGSLQYGHKETGRRQTLNVGQLNLDGDVVARDSVASSVGTESSTLGGLLNLGFHPDDENELGALVMFSRSSDDVGQELSGYSEGEGGDITANRLQYATRSLLFSQLRGYHELGGSTERAWKWQANYSLTQGSEPDTRDVTYFLQPGGGAVLKSGTRSAERVFTNLDDHSGGLSAELRLPLLSLPLRVGASAQLSYRAFDSRRLRFDFVGADGSVLELPASESLTPEYIGPQFELRESTQPEDAYRALQAVYAGYATTDLPLGEALRLIPGLRYELSNLSLEAGSSLSPVRRSVPEVHRLTGHLLPTLNAVYALTPRQNLRAGYSYTLARPQLRELGPFLYFDFARRRAISGDPTLLDTRVHNADLRWEWFPGERELLAASVFAKQFVDPIEQKVINPSGDLKFGNTPGAQSAGVELEGRASLGSLWPVLRGIRAGANLSLIFSRVQLDDRLTAIETSRVRPLQGQSPYVLNVNLGYLHEASGTEVTALYNVAGPRISEVGLNGLPDSYEQAFHRVDLTVSQELSESMRLKLSGTNLLNQPVSFKQGDLEVLSYRPGVAANATLEWLLQ